MAARAGPTKTKGGQPSAGPPLFEGLRYFIASCIPIKDHAGLRTTLASHGAIEVKLVGEAEYVFTDSESFEGANEIESHTALVLPVWIDRSIMNKTRQDSRYFSPSPRAIFSTLVIATDHLPPGDVDTIVAGIHAKGGMYRDGLTRDVTHLLVLSPTGDKYRTARRYAAQTGIKIVLVHWFDDCFKTEHRLPEGPYEAALLRAEKENGDDALRSDPIKRKKTKLPERAKTFYDALNTAGTPPLPEENSASKNASNAIRPNTNVWKGRRILLSHSLMLSEDRRSTVVTEIERYGGTVVSTSVKKTKTRDERVGSSVSEDEAHGDVRDEVEEDDDAGLEEDIQFELEFAKKDPKQAPTTDLKVSTRYRTTDLREAMLVTEDKVDVLVTKYRSGLAYLAALRRFGDRRKEVVVATLPWVFYVQYSGAFSAPTNQLLHFPVRRGAVHDIKGKAITVSNYQGPARDYIKKLISVMAGPRGPGVPEVFTATLGKQTSVVIASRLEGKKVESAQSWNIPIVNHLWLEDTFKAWRVANLAEPRYTHWRSKISYGDLLPGCPVVEKGPAELKEDAPDVMSEMKAIGYEEEDVNAAWTGNLNILRGGKGASRQSVVLPDPSTASYEEVERDLQAEGQMDVDGGADQTFNPETSSQRNPVTTSDNPSPGPDSLKGFKPPSGKRLVPVITRMRRGSPPGERIGNTTTTGPSSHDAKTSTLPQKVTSSNTQPANENQSGSSLQLPTTATTAAAPTLRSPWDPSPKKKYNTGVVTNDSPIEFRRPTKKKREDADSRTARRQAMEPFTSVDYHDVDVEDYEAQRQKERKLSAKAIAKQIDSSNESSSEEDVTVIPHHDSKSKRTQADPPSAGRGKKRNIQTQESDEEFRVETQDDLISRRRKVVHADNMEIFDSEEDEPKRGTKEQKKPSGKATKAIKRLRDSISGKEGAGPTQAGGSKPGKGRRANPPPDAEDSQSDEPEIVEPKRIIRTKATNKPKRTAKPVETSSLTPAPSDEEENPGSPPTSALTQPPTSVSKSVSSEDEEGQENPAPRARRGAATKATQLLRDKIMPDANRFAQQMKIGEVRGDWEDNKKRRRDSAVEDTDDTADKKRRRKGGDGGADTTKKREASRRSPATGIRMLTTKVVLKDGEQEKLHQMGVQTVTDPLLCTHLVSNAILRTEKFICAISVSPIIVTEQWVRECLRAKRVVDTAPYLLEDEEGETKFKFELQTCLERAQDTGKTLLKGHSFFLIYTAENADLVVRTLASAIKSAGGNVVRQVPSVRQMEGHHHDRHIISDMREQAKWAPLSQKGFPIYNQEIVLTAILRQELPDWNEPTLLLS